MRARNIGMGVLVGLATAMPSAPVALAAPVPALSSATWPGDVSFASDGSPQAGEDIDVIVNCRAGEVGTADSPILQIAELTSVEAPHGLTRYVGSATIDADTEPGDYPLTGDCGHGTLSTVITVQPPDPSGGGEVFIIADGSPQAGEDIEVAVRCWGEFTAPESPILQVGELTEVESPADIPTYVGPATIDQDAEPGDYPLTATCDGEPLSTTVTVQPSGPGDDGGAPGSGDDGDDGQVDRTPRGAPETGGGPADGPAPLLLGALAGLFALVGAGFGAGRRLVRR